MSIEATFLAWQATDCTPAAKLVLLALADAIDCDGMVHILEAKLREHCCLSEQQLTEALNGLEKSGYIQAQSGRKGMLKLKILGL